VYLAKDVITPTFKIKPNRIEDPCARLCETWEASGQSVIWKRG
jgi:long-chain acyl-CoA synthetase